MTIEYSTKIRTSPNGDVTYSVHLGQKLILTVPSMVLAAEIAEALSIEFYNGKDVGYRAAKREQSVYKEITPGDTHRRSTGVNIDIKSMVKDEGDKTDHDAL